MDSLTSLPSPRWVTIPNLVLAVVKQCENITGKRKISPQRALTHWAWDVVDP